MLYDVEVVRAVCLYRERLRVSKHRGEVPAKVTSTPRAILVVRWIGGLDGLRHCDTSCRADEGMLIEDAEFAFVFEA